MIDNLAYYGGKRVIKEGEYAVWPSPCEEDLLALKRVVAGEKYHRVNNPIVIELEEKLKKWSGFTEGRAVNTGTSAIHIGMEYFSQKHNTVIISALNWPSAVAPIYMAGMKPIYVDVNLEDACLKEDEVLNALEENSSALVFATHLFGNVSYLKKVRSYIADKESLEIFDDCSQGVGISRMFSHSEKTTYTNAIAFSGNGAKHLASGELGILLANNKELIEFVDYISLSSSSRNGERVFSPFTKGFNYRPNVFSCAIAISRLSSLDLQLYIRRKNMLYLYKNIKELKGIRQLFFPYDDFKNCYGVPYLIELNHLGLPEKSVYRDYIVDLLYAEGVPVSVWLKKPVWEYLDYEKTNCNIENFPNTKKILNTMFYITEIASPNTEDTMRKYTNAIRKVWNFVMENTNFIISEVEKKKNGGRQYE